MTSLVLGNLILESLTPSVNTPSEHHLVGQLNNKYGLLEIVKNPITLIDVDNVII
jgi:hypothetical protein